MPAARKRKRLVERYHKQGRVVVLTGAGASAGLGLPTMASFPGLLEDEGGELQKLTAAMQWQQAGLDAEGIYGRLELYAELGDAAPTDRLLRGLFDHASLRPGDLANDAREALIQMQALMLRHWGAIHSTFYYEQVHRYDQFLVDLRRLNGAPLKVFTTNYDLTFEALPSYRPEGWEVFTGLVREAGGLSMSLDLNSYLMAPRSAGILAYRLHGCSHWFEDEEGLGIVTYEPHPAIVGNVLRPMVVFPARGKENALFDEVFAFAYREFRKALASADVCLVVGYSFRDAGVRAVFTEADWHTLFVVVDPEDIDLDELLNNRLYRHVQGRFGDEGTNAQAIEACAKALVEAEARRNAPKSDVPPWEEWDPPSPEDMPSADTSDMPAAQDGGRPEGET